MFTFKITKKIDGSYARTGVFKTPHGDLQTPELAIVATDAEVRGIPKEKLSSLPIRYTISNTFHTFTQGLVPKIAQIGGVNNYMGYKNTTATDSGGFQVFSLGFGKAHGVGKVSSIFPEENTKEKGLLVIRDTDNLIHITEEGVFFSYEGKPLLFTPELSIEIQQKLGADIMFAFDECTSPLNSHEYTRQAMIRTHRWLERCLNQLKSVKPENRFQPIPTDSNRQALFGIVQGGHFEDLRKISATYVAKQDVPGFGIGGSLGRSKEHLYKILEWSIPLLPENKPRHLLGIGQVRDIFEAVERGVDLFDCVIPTREARHKVLYTKKGKVAIRKLKEKEAVLEIGCECESCKAGVTYKTLYGYYLEKNPLAFYFSTVHNIYFFTSLMENIRNAIKNKTLSDLKKEYLLAY